MLVHRLRCWPNIGPTWGWCIVFDEWSRHVLHPVNHVNPRTLSPRYYYDLMPCNHMDSGWLIYIQLTHVLLIMTIVVFNLISRFGEVMWWMWLVVHGGDDCGRWLWLVVHGGGDCGRWLWLVVHSGGDCRRWSWLMVHSGGDCGRWLWLVVHSGGDCGRCCGECGLWCMVVVIVGGDCGWWCIVAVIVRGDCGWWCIVVVIVGGAVVNVVGGA